MASYCIGPACKHCGCNDTRVLEQPGEGQVGGFYRTPGTAKCQYCLQVFKFQDDDADPLAAPPVERDAVPYVCVRCPRCKSGETFVASSPKPTADGTMRIRWHKCKECAKSFKSIETGLCQ